MRTTACFLFLCYIAVSAGSVLLAKQSVEGQWVGGYQSGRNFVYLTPHFSAEDGHLTGTTAIPFQFRRDAPLTDLAFDGHQLGFVVNERDGARIVRLELHDNALIGTARIDEREVPAHFVRVIPVSAEKLSTYRGLYELSDGTIVGVTDVSELGFPAFVDFRTGSHRSLFAQSESVFATGPGWYVPYPPERFVEFKQSESGIEILIRDKAEELTGRRLKTFREEEVRIQNGDVTLVGNLNLPQGTGPFPAVVFIHGSGPSRRGAPFMLSEYFAHLGFATLSYDKRGVGESTGTYTHEVNAEEFEKLAGDALAGVSLLRSRPEIDPRRIGFWGISQAGWIIALAASRSPDVAFSVVVSGPAVSLGEEGYFSQPTGDDPDSVRLSDAEIRARMQAVRPSGFDPRPYLRTLESPSLWIFGGRDPSVPVDLSMEVLQTTRAELGRDIATQVFPAGNHILLESEVGNRDEYPLLQRFVPGFVDTMVDWMKARSLQSR